MALGVPIVTTNGGGNPELITHEEEGLLVSFDDKDAIVKAIERVVADTALEENLVTHARTRAHSFGLERMVQHIAKELKQYERTR